MATVNSVTDIAALRLLSGTNPNDTVEVLGYYSPSDGGGGIFYWEPSVISDENGGTIIVNTANTGRWLRVYDGLIDVKWFGAKGNDSTDDADAIQKAFNSSPSKAVIFFPPGVYKLEKTIIIPDDKELTIKGSEKYSQGGTSFATVYNGISSIRWHGMNLSYTEMIKSDASTFRGTLKYLTFSNATNRTDIDGIVLEDFRASQMDMIFINLFRRNIWIKGNAWYGVFNRCTFLSAVETNVLLEGICNGLSFTECRISQSQETGLISHISRFRITFNGCYFEDNAGYAAWFKEKTKLVNFNNCHFERNGEGLNTDIGHIRIEPNVSGNNIPVTLDIYGCSIFTSPGIHFIAVNGGLLNDRGNMNINMEANSFVGNDVTDFGTDIYAVNVLSDGNNITTAFISNMSNSQLENPVLPIDLPNPSDVRSYTSINCGLGQQFRLGMLQSTYIRTPRMYIADSATLLGHASNHGISIISGSVDPEGNYGGIPGSLYIKAGNGIPVTERLYVKDNGTSTTGWVKYNTMSPAAASANTANPVGSVYVRTQVQAILDELRDLKHKLRNAGILLP